MNERDLIKAVAEYVKEEMAEDENVSPEDVLEFLNSEVTRVLDSED